MAPHVCPPIVGWFLISPIRKLIENPDAILGPYVRPGMTVLEPGCAMGFFTLPLARMVGPEGRVVALDVQAPMLRQLSRRAGRAGLSDRINARLIGDEDLGITDLAGTVDFAAAIHVVHEVPDPRRFFGDIRKALKPNSLLLVIEPSGHVSAAEFDLSRSVAEEAGFSVVETSAIRRYLRMVLAANH